MHLHQQLESNIGMVQNLFQRTKIDHPWPSTHAFFGADSVDPQPHAPMLLQPITKNKIRLPPSLLTGSH